MKKAIKILLVIAALLVVVAALTCFYVVEEDEHACVVRFSKIIDVKSEAGIYMKLPKSRYTPKTRRFTTLRLRT